jgi:multidrug efflux pump subunit AcrA (membrane-fusion protein)
VIGADDKAQIRLIKMGPPADDVAIVVDGLDAGERVVTEGYYRLQPGVQVSILPPKERSAEISSAKGRAP